MMKSTTIFKKLTGSIILLSLLAILLFTFSSCGIYSLTEKVTAIPDTIKTIKITTFENRAPYQNPQLSPLLTDRLRQKIVNQTKLTNTNSDNSDWEIVGRIDDYSVTTTGVSATNGQTQASINRLNVRVHITLNRRKENKVEEYDVSRSFDFNATQTLQAAETSLMDEMVRNLSDEIFNHLFSNW